MLVVIPTAGIGSRLGPYTEEMNKSMLLLGTKPVISRIIESYPSSTKFLIGLGYKGEHIKEFLKLAYPKKKIKFVEIDKYTGVNSSLTYTLKKLSPFINEEFFFHANDSIVKLKSNVNKKFDTLIISKKYKDSNLYRSVKFNKKNELTKLQDKTNKKLKFFSYTGVAFIKDFKLFKYIINRTNKTNGEFEYFKQILKKNKLIKICKSVDWHDIGDQDKYLNACKFYEKKSYLKKFDESIFFIKNKVYKFFTNPLKVTQRYNRAKYLNEMVPSIIEKTNFFYVYKLVKGSVLSDYEMNKKDFVSLLNWSKKKIFKKINLSKFQMKKIRKESKKFYSLKTKERIENFRRKTNIFDMDYYINKKKIPKLFTLLKKINWQELYDIYPTKFHGDFHFENIIKNKNSFKLIDWRENFSKNFMYGDLYYDLAKLNHSFIVNHGNIAKKKFFVKQVYNKVDIKISRKLNLISSQKLFYKFLIQNKFSIYKVNVLTSLIFLNIATLHHRPYSEFLYFLGLSCLNKSINNQDIIL